MKKLLSFIAVFMLLGISASNAITVNFNFSGLGGEAYEYVKVTDLMTQEPVTVDSSSLEFEYDDFAVLQFESVDVSKYNMIISAAFMDYESFNNLGEYGEIYPTDNNTLWVVTLTDAIDDGFYFTVTVSEIQGGGTVTPPTADEKNVTLKIVNGDSSLVTGMVWYSANFDGAEYLSFSNNTAQYTYTDYLGMNIYPGDNDVELEVTCADTNLIEGQDYDLYEDDGAWIITLNSSTPDNITFNISFPGVEASSKTVTLNVDGDSSLVTGMVWYSANFDGAEYLSFSNNTAQYTYTDYLGMNIYPGDNDVELEVTCADTNLISGVDYDLYEDDGVWLITLNSSTPDNITFNISFSGDEVEQPKVILNFTGEGLVEGLTIDYQDWDNTSNNTTLTPNANPYSFEVNPDALTMFSVSAEGYNINITMTEEDSEYGDYFFIDGTGVTLNPHTMDLSFNVNITKTNVSTVTLQLGGVSYQDGMITVYNGTSNEEIQITDGEAEFSYTGEGYLFIEAPVSTDELEYSLTFYSEGVNEGENTYEVTGSGNYYYVTLYPGMNGKTLVVTLDTTSAINSIFMDESITIYNINGVRIKNERDLQKGLYIINGKKVMIK